MDSRPNILKSIKLKTCIVPKCNSVSGNGDNAPRKVFFKVPIEKELKEKWKRAVGGFGRPVSEESDIYCCADHFDLHEDTSNFIDHYMSIDEQGQYGVDLKLKSNVVPHRFECQNNVKMILKANNNMEGNSLLLNNPELQYDGGNKSVQSSNQLNHRNTLNNVIVDRNEEITTNLLNNKKTLDIRNNQAFSNTNLSSQTVDKEIAIKNKYLLAICKPVKIELCDLKHAVNPKITSLHETDSNELNNDPIVMHMSLSGKRKRQKCDLIDDDLFKRRKLISKIHRWEENQSKCIAIHDRQFKELEIYHLNSNRDITIYKRFNNIEHSTLRHYIHELEVKGRKNRLKVIDCCCWFYRENFRPSIEFTKKSHRCEVYNYCSCCCRNIPSISRNIPNPSVYNSESVKVWVNEIVAKYRSLCHQDIASFNAIEKALFNTRIVHDKSIRIDNKQCDTLGIKIDNVYYKIDNGYIISYMKHQYSKKLSNYEGYNIKRNVCCWYKQEQLAVDLLKRYKVLSSTLKFIRSQHLCPNKQCECCCKPKYGKTLILPQNSLLVRHTTDVTLKNVKIRISFSSASQSHHAKSIGLNSSASQPRHTKSISLHTSAPQPLRAKSIGLNSSASQPLRDESVGLNSFASQSLNAKSKDINSSASQPLNAKSVGLNASTSKAHHAESECLNSSTSQFLHAKSIVTISSTNKMIILNPLNNTLPSMEPFSEATNLTNVPKSALADSGIPIKYANNIALESTLKERVRPPFVSNDLINKTSTPSQTSTKTENILNSRSYSANDSTIEEIDKRASTSVGTLAESIISNMMKETNSKNIKPIFDRSSKKCEAAIASMYRSKASFINAAPSSTSCEAKNYNTKNISSTIVTSSPMTTGTETNNNPICKMTSNTLSESFIENIITKAVKGTVSAPPPLLSLTDSNTQDAIEDVSCSIFTHKPKKIDKDVITRNLIGSSSTHVPSASNGIRSDFKASTSHVDKAITETTTATQPKLSIIQVLERLKNVRISNVTGGLLSAQLHTPLKNLSTTELKLLNSIMIVMENKIKSAGLVDDNVQFDCDDILKYMTPKNDRQKSSEEEIATNVVDERLKPSKVFQSSKSLNQPGFINSFSDFVAKQKTGNKITFEGYEKMQKKFESKTEKRKGKLQK